MIDSAWPYWNHSSAEVLGQLNTSPEGLSESEASRRATHGQHDQLASSRESSVGLLLAQFNNPIIWLLFVSAALSFFLDDVVNAIIIMVILLLSGLLGYWQERSAADAVAKLLAVIDTQVTVIRSGQSRQISHKQVVPGDIVVLKAGTVVPADCRLIQCREMLVDESALTGESFPIEKADVVLPADLPAARRSNCLFLGTHVASGSGQAVVLRIGRQTELGRISGRLESKAAATDFERGLNRFGKLLVVVTSLLVVAVFVVNLAFDRPVVESLLFALALAVGMTPQLLPAITSVVLARGAMIMAQQEVIIKRLVVIENFGSMDTLCMDKTGTITTGIVQLHDACDLAGASNDRVLQLAVLNAGLQSSFENPIDTAILRAANVAQAVDRAEMQGVRKLDELPYDFKRRRLSVLVEEQSTCRIITKGAVENVLEVCTNASVPGSGTIPLPETIENVRQLFRDWSQRGYRVLAVAERTCESTQLLKSDERNLTLAGLLLLADPLKPDIQEALGGLRELGVHLKLVTGDNSVVARALAASAGFSSPRMLTGTQIHGLSLDELTKEVRRTDVFAEIEPEQKEMIVTALRRTRAVVGFLGDGINDAPALHAADVGISVSGAVDVAKEAAQVVLLRSDLKVLAQGVREGRRTLTNTLKYIYFAISANFGYMLSMAIASLLLPFLPLLPTQILLINLLADFPAMALAADRVDPESIQSPRRWDMRRIIRFMFTFGLVGTCSDLATFWALIHVFGAPVEQFRSGWFTVSIMTGVLIMLIIRTRRPFFLSRPGRWLIVAALAVVGVTLLLPHTPLGPLVELETLTGETMFAAVLISSLYAVALELLKQIERHRQKL